MATSVDLIVKGKILITMDVRRRIIQDGAVAIERKKIVDVGKSTEIEKRYVGQKVINHPDMAILPGLINTHVHLYQNLLKGTNDDSNLIDWLETCLYPISHIMKEDYMSRNFSIGYHGALMGCLEMVKSGTTCFVAMDPKNPLVGKAIEETGIRGTHAFELVDRFIPDDVMLPVEEQLKEIEMVVPKWQGAGDGRVQYMIGPSSLCCCTNDLIMKAKNIAERFSLRLSMHMNETKYETERIKNEKGKSPINFLHDIGFLGPDVLAVHCVWVNNQEIEILSKNKVAVSHNPESNMKLGSGIAPIRIMLNKGVNVVLATDGCGSNDNLDMFEAMRNTALLHKVKALDASVITAEKVLEMATIDAARALGQESEIGSIEKNKKADLILIDLNKPHLQPINNIVKTLVYCAFGGDIDTVIIDGTIVMEHRKVVTIDEKNAIMKTKELMTNVKERIAEYLPKAVWAKKKLISSSE